MLRILLSSLLLIISCTAGAQTPISGTINTYREVTSITGPGSVELNSTGGFNQGDKVLVIQMKGASINTSNTDSFGYVGDYNGAGSHEWCTICEVNGDELVFEKEFINDYDVNGAIQVVDIPQYTDAEVTNTLTAQVWNGSTGGVLIFECSGTLTLNATVDVTQTGFRGGQHDESTYNCNFLSDFPDYSFPLNSGFGAQKGEGVFTWGNATEAGRGPAGNGGGGGNDHNAGGGGGSNLSPGGQGGENQDPATFTCKGYYPGVGGRSLATDDHRVFMGGGGGAGHSNSQFNSSGGRGGGIIIITANTVIGNGNSIRSNGEIGQNGFGDGSGGGGAGGTIVLDVQTFSGSIFTQVNGGDGGSSDNFTADRCFGPGGGGSGGLVWYSANTQPGTVTNQLNQGQNGVVTNTTNNGCNGQALNAAPGSMGITQFDYVMPTGNKGNQDCNYIPQVDLGADTMYLCTGSTITLDAGPDGTVSYQWSSGETTQTLDVTSAGTYVVMVDNGTCPVCDSVTIFEVPTATVNLGNDITVCDNAPITLAAGGDSTYTYAWTTGDSTQSISVTTSGTYGVTVNNGGCSAYDEVAINYVTNPIVPSTLSVEICDAPTATLDAENPGFSYLWNTGETTSTIEASETGEYSVTISSGPSCSLDATFTVTRCDVDILLPNTITPNGDGRNDTFIIEGIENFPGATVQIYNRNGNLIFETDNYQNDWDGGSLPATAYFYIIDLNIGTDPYHGSITIVR